MIHFWKKKSNNRDNKAVQSWLMKNNNIVSLYLSQKAASFTFLVTPKRTIFSLVCHLSLSILLNTTNLTQKIWLWLTYQTKIYSSKKSIIYLRPAKRRKSTEMCRPQVDIKPVILQYKTRAVDPRKAQLMVETETDAITSSKTW